MPNGSQFTPPNQPVKATELFPELSTDMDRRIGHAEMRLKFWVVAGILCNVVGGLAVGIPMIYYLGSLNSQFDSLITRADSQQAVQERQVRWMQEREIWENAVETHLVEDGFTPPRYGRDRSQAE